MNWIKENKFEIVFVIFYLAFLIWFFTAPILTCIDYGTHLEDSQVNAIRSILGTEWRLEKKLCKSDVVKLINQGKPIESCQAIKNFNLDAFEGVEYLRQYQYEMCVRDL